MQIFPNPDTQKIVEDILYKAQQSYFQENHNLFKNKVDPFSALFDSMLQEISLSTWLEKEKSRQLQKSLQNLIGDFHQNIIASFPGWENLKKGNIIDVVNTKQKILAEIKNKSNTTKGNHKIQIYRDLSKALQNPLYNDFTGYYVEIIPLKTGKKSRYNKCFTPSDNTQKGNKPPTREDIRIIDGVSFYEIVTGEKDALLQLYRSLPKIIRNILKYQHIKPENEQIFIDLFEKAFF